VGKGGRANSRDCSNFVVFYIQYSSPHIIDSETDCIGCGICYRYGSCTSGCTDGVTCCGTYI
jgi:hypothetical protein